MQKSNDNQTLSKQFCKNIYYSPICRKYIVKISGLNIFKLKQKIIYLFFIQENFGFWENAHQNVLREWSTLVQLAPLFFNSMVVHKFHCKMQLHLPYLLAWKWICFKSKHWHLTQFQFPQSNYDFLKFLCAFHYTKSSKVNLKRISKR